MFYTYNCVRHLHLRTLFNDEYSIYNTKWFSVEDFSILKSNPRKSKTVCKKNASVNSDEPNRKKKQPHFFVFLFLVCVCDMNVIYFRMYVLQCQGIMIPLAYLHKVILGYLIRNS